MTDWLELDGGRVRLACGDCRIILPELNAVDAVVTDPPYGIGFKYDGYDDSLENWESLISAVVPECRRLARFVVMPSCAINRLRWWYENITPDWLLAWHKGSPGHASKIGFNDWEPLVSWGRPTRPMHDHFQTVCGFDDNGHPCPKPIEWALWLVERAAESMQTVLDPFMGSGTTGKASVRLGRKFIGIEKSRKYFAIARDEIISELSRTPLFPDPAPLQQFTMFEEQNA